ncbi:hypothetical protein SAMN05421813_11828 [Daejeonella rubra]|uniref:Uncharacterized protein n=1 Tax=Daejeonella rubra TaxID=990371 RepID=A0A1G9UX01_9SPHI|nr:hypothetical protein SAMN05421813_11828 [Daejeonella rubra]
MILNMYLLQRNNEFIISLRQVMNKLIQKIKTLNKEELGSTILNYLSNEI